MERAITFGRAGMRDSGGSVSGSSVEHTTTTRVEAMASAAKMPRHPVNDIRKPPKAGEITGATPVTSMSRENIVEARSEEHTSALQSRFDLVCRLLLEQKNHNP